MGLADSGKGVAVFREAHEDLWWYASAIVHEAAHARDYRAGRKYWGIDGELSADMEQQRFLGALGDSRIVLRDPAEIPDEPEPSMLSLLTLGHSVDKQPPRNTP
jgi:hypothetical protein